jgi:DNA-binding transcriptional LysR family regulator
MFDYRYLNAFLATARTLSLSRAAEELAIAHSAVSRQVALLEQAIGYDLFFRGARGVELTPKGKDLYLRLSEADRWIRDEFSNSVPAIRVGGLEGMVSLWLGARLENAKPAEVPPKLVLKVLGNDQVKLALENHELDIGLSSAKIESEWISSRKLFSEKIVIISRHAINLHKIEDYRWIGVGKADYLHRAFKKNKPKRILQAGTLDLLFRLVANGDGIAAVPDSLLGDRKFTVTQLPLHGEAVYLNLPNYNQQPKHISNFIRYFMTP